MRSPPSGGVDRNGRPIVTLVTPVRSPPSGGVDRNKVRRRGTTAAASVAPIRGRGSKHFPRQFVDDRARRPHPGAWIETPPRSVDSKGTWSPPSGGVDRNFTMTLPGAFCPGRPHPGAWIETTLRCGLILQPRVAPIRGRGSKLSRRATVRCLRSSPPSGGVDRNWCIGFSGTLDGASPPSGGVDRNTLSRLILSDPTVAPIRGRGSKLSMIGSPAFRAMVAPIRGRGSKHRNSRRDHKNDGSPPSGGVDRNHLERVAVIAIQDSHEG